MNGYGLAIGALGVVGAVALITSLCLHFSGGTKADSGAAGTKGSSTKGNSKDSEQELDFRFHPSESFSSIKDFVVQAEVSPTQEKAFKETASTLERVRNRSEAVRLLSSDRYAVQEPEPTKVERDLDQGVREGDLPVPDFTIKDVQAAKNSAESKCIGKDKDVEFVYYRWVDVNETKGMRGQPAQLLYEQPEAEDGCFVNLASQFNALESVSTDPSAVLLWIQDHTQGPQSALQSIAGSKHREAAAIQGKLPDAIKSLLEKCLVDGKPITEKYKHLYSNGYLQLLQIKNKNDMEALLSFLDNNIGDMKVLMQWVRCEGSGKRQLQFFTAAPAFVAGYRYGMWNKNDEMTKLRKQICVKLIEAQYRAMAQVACIRADETGKNVKMHISMVGCGSFHNPRETIEPALKALRDELRGHDVTVFLHSFGDDVDIWDNAVDELGIDAVSLESWRESHNNQKD